MSKISDLSIQRAEKFLEYKSDPAKWAEDCVKIPSTGGDELINFYPPQRRILEAFYKDKFLILLKSRQIGFSTLSQTIVAHLVTFYSNTICGVLSRDGSESSDFCRKVTDIIGKQPKWLQPGFKVENAQSFILKNGSQLWSSAISPSNPQAVFRGKALTLLILDETAYIRYAEKAWTGIAPALSKAQNVAKKKGIPYGTIMLSTPNKTVGIGKFFFRNWSNAVNNPRSLFKAHKIHWSEIPDFVEDKEWYPKQCELLGNDPSKIAQELELQFGASDDCLFNDKIQKILQSPKPHVKIQKIKIGGGSELWKFRDFDKKRFYLVGIDTAGEFGGDFSAIEVVDYETMEQILEFKGKLSVKEFCKIVKFIANIIPNNILLVENNGLGNQVVEELFYDGESDYNVYGRWRDIKIGKTKRKKFQPGINTNVKTRPLILDSLFTYIRDNPNLIISERLSLELISLIYKGTKIEADEGCSDDLVFAYAFCCYARHYLKESLGHHVYNPTGESTTDDPFLWLRGLNSEKGALKAAASTGSRDQLNRETNRYIKKHFHEMGGYTDMLDLIGRK